MTTGTTTTSTTVFDALSLQQNVSDSVANSMLSAGIGFMQQKKYDRAAQSFRAASAMKPDLTEAYTYLGAAYSSLGKNKEAIGAYKLSLKVDKTQDTVYTTLANLYIDQKQNSDAMKVLKDGIKQNNQNTLAYYTLGQLQSQAGDYASAETNFRQVTKLEPKDGNGYYALGMALNGMGQYNEAITQLTKATSLKKNFAAAYYELGRAYAGLGNQDKVQEQIDILKNIGTSAASAFSSSLSTETARPKILYHNFVNSTLALSLGVTDTLFRKNLDGTITNANVGESLQFLVVFNFDSDMDPSSVNQVTNWQISKAGGGVAGLYDNGLYRPKDQIWIPAIPEAVSYNSETREATLTFSLKQEKAGDIIDPKRLVFKFLGKDVNGKYMDVSADQYDAFNGTPF